VDGRRAAARYRVEDHKLVGVDSEAQIVRWIFRRYAELGSVRLLNEELEAHGIKSKSWTSASGRRSAIDTQPEAQRLTACSSTSRPVRCPRLRRSRAADRKHPKVLAWLARHPRWTLHFTPTSASWLNAVRTSFPR
jgi:hypothetical protein